MFFRKKEKQKKEEPEEIEIPVAQIQEKLDGLLAEDNSDEYANIAECYHLLQEYDKAIDYYEEYFKNHYVLGKSYNALMSLYNIKRKEASLAKNDEEIQKYLTKIDDHLKFSKDITRGAL